jgi:hypothetical protein
VPLAATPDPPCTAVILTSLRTDGDQGYDAMAARMFELAAQQRGISTWDTQYVVRVATVTRGYGHRAD